MSDAERMSALTRQRVNTLMAMLGAMFVLVAGALIGVAVLGATGAASCQGLCQDGANGTNCNCSGAIQTVNDVSPDEQGNFALLAGDNVLIEEVGNGLLISATGGNVTCECNLSDTLRTVNDVPGDAARNFLLVAGSGVELTQLENGLMINASAAAAPNTTCECNLTGVVMTLNSEPPDGAGDFRVLPGANILITGSPNALVVHGTVTQGLLSINNVTGDAQDGFAITAADARIVVTATPNGLQFSTPLQQGLLSINNISGDAQNGFALVAGENVTLTQLANGIEIGVNAPPGPQGPVGPPGTNGTCGCNGTGIFTVNSEIPDGNANFDLVAGAGIAITPAPFMVTIASTLEQGIVTINNVTRDAQNGFALTSSSPNLVLTPTANGIDFNTSLLQGIVTINDVAANASRNFALLGDAHILITPVENGAQVGSDATPYNNASTIVARDASGDFAARHITAELFRAVGTDAFDEFESLITVEMPGDPRPRLTLMSGGHLLWANETNEYYDALLLHVAEATLMFQNSLILDQGWLSLAPMPPGTPYVPLNSAAGDLSAVRLVVGDGVVLGSGPDGPFVRMGSTMGASNASAVVGLYGACGAVLQYTVDVDPFAAATDGTFSGAALTLEFGGYGTVQSEMVGARSTLMIDGSGGATTLVGMDARNRVTSNTPCITCAAHVVLVSPFGDGGSAYAVGDVISLTGCSGSGATVVVTGVASQFPFPNYVTGFTVLTRGTAYVSAAGCTTTAVNGTGAGMVVLIVAGNSTYASLIGLRATAYSVDAGLDPVARLAEAVGVEVGTSNLGGATVSDTLVNNLQSQYGVRVLNQALGTVRNAGVWLQQMTGNATTNYGFYLEGIAGNTTNYGMWVGAITGAGTNVGMRIEAPEAGGSLGAALQLQAGQSSTAAGGILWGSGADSPHANLYRSAASRLTTDGALTVALDLQARAITAQQFLALPANSTEVSILTRLPGDTTNRWQTAGDGVLSWADGTSAIDTNLYRLSAARLQTDGALNTGADARITTYARVGSLSTPLNTVAGDVTAVRAMVGTPELALGEPFASTALFMGQVTAANASATLVETCGFNVTVQITGTGSVVTGTFIGVGLSADLTSDTVTVGTVSSVRLGTRMMRAGSTGTVIGGEVTNKVATNVPSTLGLLAVAVTAGGTGYVVGDQCTVTGGGGSSGTVIVAAVGGGGAVTDVRMDRPGINYATGTGRATTGGTGSGLTINIQSVGNTSYVGFQGLRAVAYSASDTYATPTVGTLTGILIASPNFGSSASLPAGPTDQRGLQINAQASGTSINRAISIGNGQGANFAANTQVLLGTMTSSNATNVGIQISALSGTNSVNIGVAVGASTGAGESTNIGLRVAPPSGGTTNIAIQINAQTTTADASILFGTGADTVSANLYRSAASTLKSDGDVTARHAFSVSATPSIAAGTGAGTSPTVFVNGTDQSMRVTVVTGTSPGTTATIFTVTFATAFPIVMYPVFSPANAAASALSGTSAVRIGGAGDISYILVSGSVALAGTTSYLWNVVV